MRISRTIVFAAMRMVRQRGSNDATARSSTLRFGGGRLFSEPGRQNMRVRLVYGRPRSTGRDRICGRLLAVLARDVLTPDAASGDVRNNAGRPPWYNNIRCLGLLFGDAEVTITTELARAEITVVTLQFRLPDGREAQLLGTELAVVELRKSQACARLDRCSPLARRRCV
jgi:hypothetical protein